MTATVPLLEVRGLTRRFGGLTAVDSVDLDVAEGEFVSIIGPNGAGKTTLFNLVTGLDEPDAGTVRLDGRDITGMAAEKLATLGMARTFQHGRVFANLSVARQRAGRRACALQGRAARPGPVRSFCSNRWPNWRSRWFVPAPSRAEEAALARRSAEDPRPLRRPPAAAHGQSGLQPVLRQPPPGRDRPRAGARARASCCSTSRPPA